MSEDEAPVKVFVGELQDVTILISLLHSGGIETNVMIRPFGSETAIYVARADARDALDLIADFKTRRTPKTD